MKYFLISNINEDELNNFIDFMKDEGELTIYIDSSGGSVHCMRTFIDIINQNKDRITLKANGYVYSSAFRIFCEAECKKEIHKLCLGMWHLSSNTYTIDERNKPCYEEGEHSFKLNKRMLQDSREFMQKIGLPEKTIKSIIRGNDEFFTCDEMMKLNIFTKQ